MQTELCDYGDNVRGALESGRFLVISGFRSVVAGHSDADICGLG